MKKVYTAQSDVSRIVFVIRRKIRYTITKDRSIMVYKGEGR